MRCWNEARTPGPAFRAAGLGLHGRSGFPGARRRPPCPAMPPRAMRAAPADQRVALGKQIEGDWWTGFRSPALRWRDHGALSGNQDLEAARNRMAEAEEEVNAAEGALLPQVSLGATAGYQKYGRSLFGPLNFSIPPFAYYTLGPTVSFPLDLFGGEKRSVEERKALSGISGLRTGRGLSVAHRPCRRRGAGAGFSPGRTRSARPASSPMTSAMSVWCSRQSPLDRVPGFSW